jgi:hypothetical protein
MRSSILITGFGFEYFKRLIETAKENIGKNFVAVHIADDWGTQETLLTNPGIFYKYYAAAVNRIINS